MTLRGIAEHRHVGGDQRIDAEVGGLVHRALPALPALRAGIGVDRYVELPPGLVDSPQAFLQLAFVKVEAGEMAGVGVVAETDVDGIGALSQGRLQGGQAARRTDQLHGVAPLAKNALRGSGQPGAQAPHSRKTLPVGA